MTHGATQFRIVHVLVNDVPYLMLSLNCCQPCARNAVKRRLARLRARGFSAALAMDASDGEACGPHETHRAWVNSSGAGVCQMFRSTDGKWRSRKALLASAVSS